MENQTSHLKQWWLSLISGVILLLLCLWIFVMQSEVYTEIVLLLAIGFAIIGGLRAYYGYNHRKTLRYWALLFINGLIEFCVFLIPLVANSTTVENFIPLYIGFILLFRTILGIGVSLNFYYSHLSGWGVVMGASILGLIASFFMIWEPVSSGITFLIYPALTFLFVGIMQLGVGFGLKVLNNKVHS